MPNYVVSRSLLKGWGGEQLHQHGKVTRRGTTLARGSLILSSQEPMNVAFISPAKPRSQPFPE